MSDPKTLLQMTGAKLAPPPLAESTLILIDIQNEYVTGALPLLDVDAAVAEAAKVLEAVRQAGGSVIHVAHAGNAGGPFDREDERGQFVADVMPVDGETIVEKPLPNAFAKTSLKAAMETAGRANVIYVGFMTHMCVSSTVRAGLDLGYLGTVVASACTTRDLPDPMGGVVFADQLHRAALTALSDRFAYVVPNANWVTEAAG